MVKTINKVIIGLIALYIIATLIDFKVDARQAKTRLSKNPIAYYLIQEREKVKEKSKAVTLSYFVPKFDHMIETIEYNRKIDPGMASAYIKFYEKSLKFYPHQVDIHALLGLNYFYRGELAKSLDHYQKATEFNNYFFWNHYNLAILYFKNEQYEKSLISSNEALSKRPEIALKIINTSPVYKYIWKRMGDIEHTLIKNYKTAYQDVFALIVLNQFKLENYPEAMKVSAYALNQDFTDKDFFYYYSGLAALKLNQNNNAALFLKKCIDYNEGNRNCYIQLALILKSAGNEQTALALLQIVSNLDEAISQKLKEDTIGPRVFWMVGRYYLTMACKGI